MTTYTWKGPAGLITDPNKWNPKGLPGPSDVVLISSGLAIAQGNHTLPGVSLTLGNPSPQDAPTLQLVNAGTTDVLVGTYTGTTPIAPPQYANLTAVGTNTLGGAVGGAFMGEPDQSTLNLRNVGTLILGAVGAPYYASGFTAPSHLNVTNIGLVEGGLGADFLTITGGEVENANFYTTIGFHYGQGDLNLAGTTLGPNVTIGIQANSDDIAGIGNAHAEIGNATSASDVITITAGVLNLEKTLSFVAPPPEQINLDALYGLVQDNLSEVVFKSPEISAASYANGILTLDLVGNHTIPLHIALQGFPTEAYGIAESAPAHGIVAATLAPLSSSGPMLTTPAGGQLIHIT